MANDSLKPLIDPSNLSDGALKAWVDSRLALLQNITVTKDVIDSFAVCTLDYVPADDYGAEASPEWRRFFWGVLLADWACYEKTADRLDIDRLRYIMSSAYPHFRLWTCRLPSGEVVPVGYTGWYPIARFVFDALCHDPVQIDDRGAFLPLRSAVGKPPQHAYILNVSIIAPLRNTICAQRMLHVLRAEWRQYRQANIAAITVAEAGCRMAELAGLKKAGSVQIQGETETLFIRKVF